jgi:hypothetical protein
MQFGFLPTILCWLNFGDDRRMAVRRGDSWRLSVMGGTPLVE